MLLFQVLLCALPAHAEGRNLLRQGYGKWHRGLFGIKAGLVHEGTVRLNGEEKATKLGLSGGVFFDVPVTAWSMLGISADVHSFQALSRGQALLDIGLAVKIPAYLKKAEMALKPGAAVGFAHLAQISYLEASDYLSLKVFFEAVFYTKKKYAWTGEFAVYYLATGGNSEYDVTWGPVVMLRGGVNL
jgi:hypothetical protein